MDGKQKDSRYERWLARAAAAYERMFDGKSREELVTLTEREDMAVSLELFHFRCSGIRSVGNSFGTRIP